ncbi:uncharacterized protein LOC106168285 isoform X1 [Lingula anatina]|uniref:Uncharacterized protein LOC106168285 isoform X1 n=3 Tax=Lingula anatina TaxID=7574 RepID=A0A1S3IYX5_LINAN|nr:uncharacterized protein LOC106168285 isoform X1 [Lingula anatina]|eukprot:XP_013402749.1 uncharacterized protein LOC106168285 isoform X1 [Lingula anatina]
MEGEYRYTDNFEVTSKMKEDYDRLGYVIIRNLLDQEELDLLKKTLEDNDGITKHAYELSDGIDRKSKMALWMRPGNDVTGLLARSEKVAKTAEMLMGHGEVYHWHAKLMMKEARTGGRFLWHQDFGYWYQDGVLFPDHLSTAFIAYDKTNKENGCLQILQGSHRAGRIDHVLTGGQTGANVERVEQLMKHCPLVYVELNPGDCLFFHSNLVHRSDKNDSDHRRWALLVAYNTKKNNPVTKTFLPEYFPLDMVANSAVRECTNFTDMAGKEFLDPRNDHTVNVDAK